VSVTLACLVYGALLLDRLLRHPLEPLPKTLATVLDLLPFLAFLLLVGLRRLQQPLRLTQGWPSCPPLLRTSSASQPPSPCSHRLHKSKLHHHLSQTAPLRSDEA